MATNTRQARKEAENKRNVYFNNYMSQLCILFNESVEVENLPSDLPKRYLLNLQSHHRLPTLDNHIYRIRRGKRV